MNLRQRTFAVVGGMLLVIAVSVGGYAAGEYNATHPSVLIGDGYVGADQATLQAGDASYGFRSSVRWTDETGSQHDSGWPTCLPRLQAVTGVRFVGATVWAGNIGQAQVVWVDCQGQ